MNSTIDIKNLVKDDAPSLAVLLSEYVQALHRGAPPRPDQHFAATMLQDNSCEFLGAFINGALVGFLMYFDLPEPLSNKRAGQAEHVFVHHDHRGKGIAKALVDVLADQAEARGWSKLFLNAPRTSELGNRVFSSLAAPADRNSYVMVF